MSEKYWDLCSILLQQGYFNPQNLKAIEKFMSKKIKGDNLDIGGGWYPYCENKVIIDNSIKSLKRNAGLSKIKYNLDNLKSYSLPFKNNQFDSATLISVIQYLEFPRNLFLELNRILKPLGKIYVINSHGDSTKHIQKFLPANNEKIYQELLKYKYKIKRETIPNTNKNNLIQCFEISFD